MLSLSLSELFASTQGSTIIDKDRLILEKSDTPGQEVHAVAKKKRKIWKGIGDSENMQVKTQSEYSNTSITLSVLIAFHLYSAISRIIFRDVSERETLVQIVIKA